METTGGKTLDGNRQAKGGDRMVKWLAAAVVAAAVVAAAVALGVWLPVREAARTHTQVPVEVRVTAAEGVVMGGYAVTGAEMRARLRQLHIDDPARGLVVRAEPGARYHWVKEVLRDVQQTGFANVTLESHATDE